MLAISLAAGAICDSVSRSGNLPCEDPVDRSKVVIDNDIFAFQSRSSLRGDHNCGRGRDEIRPRCRRQAGFAFAQWKKVWSMCAMPTKVIVEPSGSEMVVLP